MPFALMVALVLGGADTKLLLRFQHRAGEVARFRYEAKTETFVKSSTGAESPTGARSASFVLERRTIRVEGGKATVEETPIEGTSVIESGGEKVSEIVQPVTRVYVLDSLGRCLSFARKSPPGVKNPGKEFLDGLSFVLPAKAVAPGAAWSAEQTTPGLQGGEVMVRMDSRFERIEMRSGRKVAHIRVALGARLGAEGSLSGKATFLLDIARGAELATTGDMTVRFRAPAAGGQSTPGPETTIKTSFRQSPIAKRL